jgi:glutaredoxin-related protein
MKITSALTLLLASSASAFAPSAQNKAPSSNSALAASSVNGDVQPNPAIKVMAQGMSLLKPIFGAEAQLQAALLGKIGGVDSDQVSADILTEISKNKIVIYTYSLSPFSSEAVRLLQELGYDFEQIELGAEWFLLGGEESVARVELSKLADNGATSLPKVFIGGECIGGCSELASLVESGEFDELMKQNKVTKAGAAKQKAFGLF